MNRVTNEFIRTTLRTLTLVGACATLTRAQAADDGATSEETEPTTYYLTVNEGGSSQNAYKTPSLWTNANGTAETTLFQSTHDYAITGSKTFRFYKTIASFGGHSLTISGSSAEVQFRNCSASTPITFGGAGLILENKGTLVPYQNNSAALLTADSTVTVRDRGCRVCGSGDAKFQNGIFDCRARLVGDEGSELIITTTRTNFTALVTGDLSQFKGSFVTRIEAKAQVGSHTTFKLGSSMVGGITNGATTTFSTTAFTDRITVGALAFKAGSDLIVPADSTGADNSSITVTGDFAIAADAKPLPVSITGITNVFQMSAIGTTPILTVPDTCDLSADDFALDDASFPETWIARPTLAVTTDTERGTKSLVLASSIAKTVSLTVTDSYSRSDKIDYSSALTNAAQWSDGNLPEDPNVSYLLQGTDSYMWLRTPRPTDDPVVFAGKNIILGNRGRFLDMYTDFTADIYAIGIASRPNIIYFNPNVKSSVLRGSLHVCDTTLALNAYSTVLTVESSILGRGTINPYLISGGATSDSFATLHFPNSNPDFRGTWAFTSEYNDGYDSEGNLNEKKITPRFDRNYLRVYLGSTGVFGAPLETFNPMGIKLCGMNMLLPEADTTLLDFNDKTHGLFIGHYGRLNATNANQTIRVACPLAVHGQLWKEGPGTLVLANPQPTFGADALATTPDADDTNRMFVVALGNVKIESAYALNGLDIHIKDKGTRIILDPTTTDDDLASYGLVNARTPGTPFDVDLAENLTFAVDSATEPTWSTRTIGLCTVPTTKAAAVRDVIKTAKVANSKFRIASVTSVETTVDGVACTTFKAEVTRYGLCLIVE